MLLQGFFGGGDTQTNFQQNDVKTQNLYMTRQFNRYMRNSIYRTKTGQHNYSMQNSFRGAGSQSPDLIFPGNLSVLRPPPGFEHIIPKGLLQ